MEVVPLRPVETPPLDDIPARLRKLADDLEREGEAPDAAVVLLTDNGMLPMIYTFGSVDGDCHPALVLHMALHQIVTNQMKRTV